MTHSMDWLCELLGRPGPPPLSRVPVPVPPPADDVQTPAPVPVPLPPPLPVLPVLPRDEDEDPDVETTEWIRDLVSRPPPLPRPPPEPPLTPPSEAETQEWLRELITRCGCPLLQRRGASSGTSGPAAPAAPAVPLPAVPVRRARSRSARRAAIPSPSSAALRPRRIAEVGGGGSSSSSGRRFSVGDLASAFPGPALAVPRQGEIVREFLASVPSLSGTPASPAASFDAVLDLRLGCLARWLSTFETMMVFKVGICHDPEHRWLNREYGYIRDRSWHAMDLVYAGTSDECRQLEIGLISVTQSMAGSQNIRPGGEGVAAGSASVATCYVYFVMAGCGHGLGLTSAWAQRTQALRDRSA